MNDFQKYIAGYINQIPTENWMEELVNSGAETIQIFAHLSDEQALLRYAPEKWTLKQLLLHLIDAERIFLYRALRFARQDKTELAGWDENPYAENSFANERTLKSLLEEFRAVRQSTIIFFETLDNSALKESGVANGNEIYVETLAKLIVGHNYHHLRIIRERYLTAN